jgi:hypothetical protein
VTLDSEQALRQSVHQARVDVAKDAVSRSRAAADFVRNAAAALVTIYTGVIGATFAVTKEPLPERGLVPALFLGAAIVSRLPTPRSPRARETHLSRRSPRTCLSARFSG